MGGKPLPSIFHRGEIPIEPTIGYMKADGKFGRNWLKGALGDPIHTVLWALGIILRKLRLLSLFILLIGGLPIGRSHSFASL